METLGYILAGLTAVYLWTNKVHDMIFFKEVDLEHGIKGKAYRMVLLGKIDNMKVIGYLINCGTCLTFWTGITLFYLKGDIFFLSLPLYYKLLKL